MTNKLAEPLDIAERRRAVGDLDKNLLVLAGAGTGKTTLLVDRLALLILGKGLPVEKIVALTFTKKAAEEMRVRLEEILRQVIATLDTGEDSVPASSLLWPLLSEKYSVDRPHWKTRAEKALADIPKAQIGTIHSFAGYLLRLYPLQSKVDPRFIEDDGSETAETVEEEWVPWLLKEFDATNENSDEWAEVLARISLENLKELCHKLLSSKVDPSRFEETVDLRPMASAARKELESMLAKYPISKRATKFGPFTQGILTVFREVEGGACVTEEVLECVDDKCDVPSDWKKVDGLEEAFVRLRRLAQALARVDDAFIEKILALLHPFIDKLRADLARRGCVSFDELLLRARDLVKNHPLVRRALKKQFDTFLIDEFQDTDPLQGEILFYLAENLEQEIATWEKGSLGVGRLFVVGDPKQSIYRFRGADMAAFAAFSEKLLQTGEEAALSHNFRSKKPILDFVNTVTPLSMKAEAGIQPVYAELETSNEDETPAVAVLKVNQKETGGSADDRRAAEAVAIAEYIQKSVKEGRNYSDFTLLFRTTSNFHLYLQTLHRFGVPYLAEGEKYFYHTPEVVEFTALLSCLNDPNDRIALVGVLRSPVGALNDREIFDLHKMGGLDYLRRPAILKERLEPLFTTLQSLHQEALRMPLGAYLEKVLKDTRFLWLAAQSLQGEQAVANLQKIRLLAESWSGQEPLSLAAFLQRFRRYREDEKEEGENPLADANVQAVKVMTIHKAKGLEFPVVIFPDLHRREFAGAFNRPVIQSDWRTGRVGLRLPGARLTNSAMVLNELNSKQREDAEEVRVFYVALTRAKHQLTLVLAEDKATGIYSSYLSKVGEFPKEGDEAWISESLAIPVWNVTVDREKALRAGSSEKAPPKEKITVKKLAELWKSREEYLEKSGMKPVIQAPTRLLAEPEKKFFPDDDNQSVRETAIQLGLVCHKVLEDWDYDAKFSGPKLGAAVVKAGRLYELNPATMEDKLILNEAVTILDGYLKSGTASKLKESKILARELPFVYPLPEGIMRGVIDLLYEDKDGLVVADYKTTKVKPGKMKETAAKYAAQSLVYREAIRRVFKKDVRFEILFLRNGETIEVN